MTDPNPTEQDVEALAEIETLTPEQLISEFFDASIGLHLATEESYGVSLRDWRKLKMEFHRRLTITPASQISVSWSANADGLEVRKPDLRAIQSILSRVSKSSKDYEAATFYVRRIESDLTDAALVIADPTDGTGQS